MKQLRAQGEKLSIEELNPKPPSDGFNGAPALNAAAASVARLGPELSFSTMKYIAPGKARVTWQLSALPSETNANIWPDLQNLLDQYRPTLPALHAGLNATWMDHNLDYSQGPSLMLHHLVNIKSTAQFLCYMAILDLHEGRGDDAKKNLQGAIRLANLYGSEPLMISQLVTLAITRIAFGATWESLYSSDWKEAELAELQAKWEAPHILQNAETALAMERAMEIATMDNMRSSSAAFRKYVNGPGTGNNNVLTSLFSPSEEDTSIKGIGLRMFGPTLWRWWWSYNQEIADLRCWQGGIEALRQIQTQQKAGESLKSLRAEDERWGKALAEYDYKFPMACDTTRFCERILNVEVRRRMMVAAIALKRYHLRNGKYPAELAQLVPNILPKVPVDLMDGQPLRYRLKDEQHFVLYSIGLDGKDDGGDVSETASEFAVEGKFTGRDWVYPEPASVEEVAEAAKVEAAKKDRKKTGAR